MRPPKNLRFSAITLSWEACGCTASRLEWPAGSAPTRLPKFWYLWRFEISILAVVSLHVAAPNMHGYNLLDKLKGVKNCQTSKVENSGPRRSRRALLCPGGATVSPCPARRDSSSVFRTRSTRG